VPATTSVAALQAKRDAARAQCHVDVAFWGGIVPGNAPAIDPLVDGGVRGFKCFLVPSGVDEFPAVGESDLRAAMPLIAKRSVPLLVHAEIFESSGRSTPRDPQSPAPSPRSYASYLATRPPDWEVDAVRLMIRLASEFGVSTHIVHVACAEAVDEIARAKGEGVPITAETCPHYLTFDADGIPEGATQFKCAPPIRNAWHRSALQRGLRSGALDLVATDHSPAPPSLKCPGDFPRAWGGIASLELSLPSTWTALAKAPGSTTETADLARWMSEAPARLAGLSDRKGRLAVGCDADLVIWDADGETVVAPERLQQRHKLTPYAGRLLRGVVHTTFLRGRRVWDNGALMSARTGLLL
jgi:allantoinase